MGRPNLHCAASVSEQSREQRVAVEGLSLEYAGREIELQAVRTMRDGVLLYAEVDGHKFLIRRDGTRERIAEQEVTGSPSMRRGGSRPVGSRRRVGR